jgi:hypothetical protein
MKKHIALGLVASTLFVAGCCTTHHVTKWEYKQIASSMVTDETLNQLGDQGWSVVGYGTPEGGRSFYILKRAKQ